MENKVTKVNLRALFNKSYAGQYITPVEIDHPIKVKIASLKKDTVRSWQKGAKPEDRLILHFEGKDRGMVINKTNFKKLADLFGWDEEKWIGQEIILETVEVEAFGRVVDSIVIQTGASKPTPVKEPKGNGNEVVDPEEVKV